MFRHATALLGETKSEINVQCLNAGKPHHKNSQIETMNF